MGTSSDGTYSLDKKGVYTFSSPLPAYHIGGGDIMFGADANNQLRTLSIESVGGSVMGMWLVHAALKRMNTRLTFCAQCRGKHRTGGNHYYC